MAQQQLTRWQEHGPPSCSISAACSRRAAQSCRLHLRDRQLQVPQLRRWQLRAEQLAQQQLTHGKSARLHHSLSALAVAVARRYRVGGTWVTGNCGSRNCRVGNCKQIILRSRNCPAGKSTRLHHALSARAAAVSPCYCVGCTWVTGNCGPSDCRVDDCKHINWRSSNCPVGNSTRLHHALSALDAAVAPRNRVGCTCVTGNCGSRGCSVGNCKRNNQRCSN